MIGVFAKASVKSEYIEEFQELAQKLVEATREFDAGCISYDFGPLIEEGTAGEFAFLERWESLEALDAHMNAEHFKQIVGSWDHCFNEPQQISLYEL